MAECGGSCCLILRKEKEGRRRKGHKCIQLVTRLYCRVGKRHKFVAAITNLKNHCWRRRRSWIFISVEKREGLNALNSGLTEEGIRHKASRVWRIQFMKLSVGSVMGVWLASHILSLRHVWLIIKCAIGVTFLNNFKLGVKKKFQGLRRQLWTISGNAVTGSRWRQVCIDKL
jgi:hypothetical protein